MKEAPTDAHYGQVAVERPTNASHILTGKKKVGVSPLELPSDCEDSSDLRIMQ